LQAFFAPAVFRKDLPVARAHERESHALAEKEYQKLVKPIADGRANIEEPYRLELYEARLQKIDEAARVAHRTDPARRTFEQKAIVEKTARLVAVSPQDVAAALSKADKERIEDLTKELKKFADRKPRPLPTALGIQDGQPIKTEVLVRGELNHP